MNGTARQIGGQVRLSPSESEYNVVDTIEVLPDRILVHTREIPPAVSHASADITVIYEFTPQMEIKGARFDHRYWDLHRRLELEGKLNHARSECPERNGPSMIRSWSPEGGWQDISIR